MPQKNFRAGYCPDCGPASVVHWVERWSTIFDRTLTPALKPFATVTRAIEPLFRSRAVNFLLVGIFRTLAFLRLGTITKDLDEKDNLRTRALWESAKKRGVEMWEFRLFGRPGIDFYVARVAGRMLVFEGLPRPGRRSSAALDWMDDKGVLKKKLSAAGLPVAEGGAFTNLSRAREVLHKSGVPLIAKPSVGSRSRHTTVGIRDEEALVVAFRKAKQLSPWVIVERELRGPVFRGTVVGGRLAGIISRDLPHVIGNGRSTILELVREENSNPARRGPIFHELPVGPEAETELALQGLGWDSVPEQGRSVRLHSKASRSFGASTTDVTDKAHPENVAVLESVARMLKDPLVGIDFIIQDISRSWREQDACGVIECNSLPFLDLHHYPLFGEPRDVAGMLWDVVIAEGPGGSPDTQP